MEPVVLYSGILSAIILALIVVRFHHAVLGYLKTHPGTTVLALYLLGTGTCNFVGVHTAQQEGTRAAQISLINLLPLFFSGGRELGAQMTGLSLQTYEAIHRTIGFMSVLQATIHIIIVIPSRQFSSSDNLQFYGLVVSGNVPLSSESRLTVFRQDACFSHWLSFHWSKGMCTKSSS